MKQPDLIDLFIVPLEKTGIQYMVSGSVAATIYGEPRATLDVDIAIMLNSTDKVKFADAYPSVDYYVPPVEILEIEINRTNRGHFNVIHNQTGSKADFYPSRSHPFFDWAFENSREVKFEDRSLMLCPPEYVILWKLEFFREGGAEKHVQDIVGVLRVTGEELDTSMLTGAINKLNLDKQWATVQEQLKSNP